MKITKYAHSCVTIEKDGARLVIDPGEWTPEFGGAANVAAVVITHSHSDHVSPSHIDDIIAANPETRIYAPAGVTELLPRAQITEVAAGDMAEAGPFELRFFGGEHAPIHSGYPLPANLGVLVDGRFYHPGDSFALPGAPEAPASPGAPDVSDAPIELLAVPVSAPWLKLGESIDFMRTVKPTACFPIHDAVLSDIGRDLADNWMAKTCAEAGVRYLPLHPGESTEI